LFSLVSSLYNKLYKVQFRATYDSFKEGKRASASLQYPEFLETNQLIAVSNAGKKVEQSFV
jgi:hypothetical protein